MDKLVVLRLNLSVKEYDASLKLRDKIDDFATAVNDRLCDKFNEEILFDSKFDNENGTLVFTIDSPKALNETCKTIDKLLKDKKFTSLANRKVELDEQSSCQII